MIATIAWVHRRDLAGGPFVTVATDAPVAPVRPRAFAIGWAVILVGAFAFGAATASTALSVGAGALLTAGSAGRQILAGVDLSP